MGRVWERKREGEGEFRTVKYTPWLVGGDFVVARLQDWLKIEFCQGALMGKTLIKHEAPHFRFVVRILAFSLSRTNVPSSIEFEIAKRWDQNEVWLQVRVDIYLFIVHNARGVKVVGGVSNVGGGASIFLVKITFCFRKFLHSRNFFKDFFLDLFRGSFLYPITDISDFGLRLS